MTVELELEVRRVHMWGRAWMFSGGYRQTKDRSRTEVVPQEWVNLWLGLRECCERLVGLVIVESGLTRDSRLEMAVEGMELALGESEGIAGRFRGGGVRRFWELAHGEYRACEGVWHAAIDLVGEFVGVEVGL